MDALPLRTRLAILVESIVQVCYVGVTGRPSRWTKVALVTAVGELVIFVGWASAARCVSSPLVGGIAGLAWRRWGHA